MIITIDGPSGTGKSTVAKGVAKRLGFTFFDTGAMYRSFAWLIQHLNIDPNDIEKVVAALPQFQYELRNIDKERHYFVQNHDVTHAIRTQAISNISSQIAVYPKVREAMVKIQRQFGESVDAVFEGRDMGTVVFPSASLKIFLTANPSIRAERRYRELVQKFPDLQMTKEQIMQEIVERDKTDMTRKTSPLQQAKDAILIDTSDLSAQQVIDKIVSLLPKPIFPKMKPSYKIVHSLIRFFFKTFYRLKIYGAERLPSGSAIIISNHTSLYDPPVLSVSCPEEVHFLAKKSLFKIPIFGSLIRMLNSHPVTKKASDLQMFKTILGFLSEGKKILLFPEGKRSKDGNLLPFERGFAFLVQKAHCKIIPAYIAGAFEVWPISRRFPKMFGKIQCVFGSPIHWDEFAHMEKKEAETAMLDRAKGAVENLQHWLESGAIGQPP